MMDVTQKALKENAMLSEQDVRAAIASVVDTVDAAALDAAADFDDCGLDSLDHASVILRIDELFGLRVADGDLDECRSIAAIVAYFRAPQDA
jgi:acyl carrier protein